MRNGHVQREEARQDAQKTWMARALDLGQRFCAAYTMTPADYVIGAPIASALLTRMAVVMLRNGASFSELEQYTGEPTQPSRVATGVHLGSYAVDGVERPVFLTSIESLDEPLRSSDPAVASSIFLEPFQPTSAQRLTLGRLAAIHLGLCRLLARASSDLAPVAEEAAFFAPSRPHPLAERALALARWAEEQRVARPADWETLLRERATAAAAERQPKRLLDRPRKQPLREIWHRIFRSLSGRHNLLDYPFLVRPKQILVVERRTRTVLLRLPLNLDLVMRTGHELRSKSGIAYQPAGALFVDPDVVDGLADLIFMDMSKLRPDCAGVRP
jgi:hypothetical protein